MDLTSKSMGGSITSRQDSARRRWRDMNTVSCRRLNRRDRSWEVRTSDYFVWWPGIDETIEVLVATREVEGGVGAVQTGNRCPLGTGRRLEQQQEQQQKNNKRFYTPASSSLQDARRYIASKSFERSQKRLKRISEDRDDLKKYRSNQEYAVGLYVVFQRISHWTQTQKTQIKQQVQHTEQSTHDCESNRWRSTFDVVFFLKRRKESIFGYIFLVGCCETLGQKYVRQQWGYENISEMCKLTYRGHKGRVQFVDFHPNSWP